MPRRRASDPEEQEELLGSVIRQAESLMRILTAVLEISRSEALTGRNQFSWFDVGELAAELAEMYDPLAEERGAVLDMTGRRGRCRCSATASCSPRRSATWSRMRSATARAAARSASASSPANGRSGSRSPTAGRAFRPSCARGPAPLRPARFEPFGRRRRARPRARRGDRAPPRRQAAAGGQCARRSADRARLPVRGSRRRRACAQPSMTTFVPTLVRP